MRESKWNMFDVVLVNNCMRCGSLSSRKYYRIRSRDVYQSNEIADDQQIRSANKYVHENDQLKQNEQDQEIRLDN
jgi:predicted Rossmann fold nucleotide-binding protein DprA/Smf involved in DNA uptake